MILMGIMNFLIMIIQPGQNMKALLFPMLLQHFKQQEQTIFKLENKLVKYKIIKNLHKLYQK